MVRHHVLPGRRRREASGSRKTWLDPAGDLRHVGPATPAAVRHPTPRPLIYLPPADPFAGTPSPLPTVLTLPTLSAAAGTLLSLSPLRRRDPRERERESRHGRRGGRGRRDGRRPEAAHVRGRVSAYPSTPTFSSPALFLLRRVPCRLRSRIRDLLVPAPGRASGFARLLSPPGFPFSRLPSCVCPAGSRGGGFGFVPVIGDQGMHSRCWEHRVVVSRA